MPLPWTDETGLLSNDVFTNCDIPKNLIGCIGFATDKIDESLTASLVSPDVLVQAMTDCNEYIFNEDLDSKISTMMTDCNQVFSFLFSTFSYNLFIFSGCSRFTRVAKNRARLSSAFDLEVQKRFQL